ncbi:MAG: hypothetical protein CM15mP49_02360 [Actinomycetota bacterium]|nr:MAG: hypothetical protein CM15mP49_02360 [Actinomycetota bacterium]
MGADPLPKTAQELKEWVNSHPDLADSKALREAIEFLKILRFQNGVNRVPHTAACCSNNYRTDLRMLLGLRSSKLNLLMGKC